MVAAVKPEKSGKAKGGGGDSAAKAQEKEYKKVYDDIKDDVFSSIKVNDSGLKYKPDTKDENGGGVKTGGNFSDTTKETFTSEDGTKETTISFAAYEDVNSDSEKTSGNKKSNIYISDDGDVALGAAFTDAEGDGTYVAYTKYGTVSVTHIDNSTNAENPADPLGNGTSNPLVIDDKTFEAGDTLNINNNIIEHAKPGVSATNLDADNQPSLQAVMGTPGVDYVYTDVAPDDTSGITITTNNGISSWDNGDGSYGFTVDRPGDTKPPVSGLTVEEGDSSSTIASVYSSAMNDDQKANYGELTPEGQTIFDSLASEYTKTANEHPYPYRKAMVGAQRYDGLAEAYPGWMNPNKNGNYNMAQIREISSLTQEEFETLHGEVSNSKENVANPVRTVLGNIRVERVEAMLNSGNESSADHILDTAQQGKIRDMTYAQSQVFMDIMAEQNSAGVVGGDLKYVTNYALQVADVTSTNDDGNPFIDPAVQVYYEYLQKNSPDIEVLIKYSKRLEELITAFPDAENFNWGNYLKNDDSYNQFINNYNAFSELDDTDKSWSNFVTIYKDDWQALN